MEMDNVEFALEHLIELQRVKCEGIHPLRKFSYRFGAAWNQIALSYGIAARKQAYFMSLSNEFFGQI